MSRRRARRDRKRRRLRWAPNPYDTDALLDAGLAEIVRTARPSWRKTTLTRGCVLDPRPPEA